MNIIFFGNTHHSVIVIQALFKAFGLSAIVTTTDKPIGRKHTLTPTPTKSFAVENHIPVIEADKLDSTIIDVIKTYEPDFLVVADYGLFLPNKLLALPKYAPLNVHHSLLPKYPGPTPAPSAILAGDKISGVSVIIMTDKIDAGDIVGQETYTLKPDETTDSLLTALNKIGGNLVVSAIEQYTKGTVTKKPQDQSNSVYTPHLSKQSGYIDFAKPPSPEMIDRMIRAYYSWPGVWTRSKMKDAGLKIIKFLPNKMIQVEGKKPMSYKDFANGYPEGKYILEKLP